MINNKFFFLFFFVFFFLGCSTKQAEWKTMPSKAVEERMAQILPKVCLDGEGKAKISYSESKSFVSYSSMLKAADKEWAVGIDVPLHGEETLMVNWSNYPEAPVTMSGTLASRLENQSFMNGESQLFFEGLISFFDWILFTKGETSSMKSFHCWGQSDTATETGYCQLDFHNSSSQEVNFRKENKKQLFFLPFGDSKSVVMALESESEKYFEKVAFHIVQKGEEKRFAEKDGMEFFVKSCAVR